MADEAEARRAMAAASTSATSTGSSNQKSKFVNVLEKIGQVAEAIGTAAESINAAANQASLGSNTTTASPLIDTSSDNEDAAIGANKSNNDRDRLVAQCNRTYRDMVQRKMDLHSEYRKLNTRFLEAQRDFKKWGGDYEGIKDRCLQDCLDKRREIRDYEAKMRQYRKDCYSRYKVSVPFNAIETTLPKFYQ